MRGCSVVSVTGLVVLGLSVTVSAGAQFPLDVTVQTTRGSYPSLAEVDTFVSFCNAGPDPVTMTTGSSCFDDALGVWIVDESDRVVAGLAHSYLCGWVVTAWEYNPAECRQRLTTCPHQSPDGDDPCWVEFDSGLPALEPPPGTYRLRAEWYDGGPGYTWYSSPFFIGQQQQPAEIPDLALAGRAALVAILTAAGIYLIRRRQDR